MGNFKKKKKIPLGEKRKIPLKTVLEGDSGFQGLSFLFQTPEG